MMGIWIIVMSDFDEYVIVVFVVLFVDVYGVGILVVIGFGYLIVSMVYKFVVR